MDEAKREEMEQRIKARRAQLDAKLRAKRAGNVDTAKHEEAETRLGGRGEEQVRSSRSVLTDLRSKAQDAVSKYRVKTDTDENERRVREETLAASRVSKTEVDSANSQTRHAAITMQFDDLMQILVPQDLAREMTQQREQCRKVIDAKDKLTDEFRAQMRDKEEEYVTALKRQSIDIEELIREMHAQTQTMVAAYGKQLRDIEEAYSQERREMLEAYDKDIEQLVQQRATKERESNRHREERVKEDQRRLELKFEENAEKYNKCKMDNQHDIHGLAQELERCKADYQLNAERLNYNLQVLRERVRENKNAQNQHKRKLTRLQDVLSSLNARYHETDKRFRQANNELTESYRRVTEQYKDLQLKFQHFEKADAEKYRQVWAMHENDCMKLVHKCLQGDRVVFEELLGVPWVPPSLDFWLQTNTDASEAAAEEDDQERDETGVELSDQAQAMLQVLYTQVPFLIEERAHDVIAELEALEDEDADHDGRSGLAHGGGRGGGSGSAKVEAILESLGIRKTEEVNELLDYFTVESEDGATALINPQEAVRALHRFLEDRRKEQATKLELSGVAGGGSDSGAGGGADGSTIGGGGAASETKLRNEKRRAERDFWTRMANVVPSGHLRIWEALEQGLEKYLAQLQQRSALIEQTDAIRKQNDELRGLLNQYLGSKINEELFSPPQLQVMGTGAPRPSS